MLCVQDADKFPTGPLKRVEKPVEKKPDPATTWEPVPGKPGLERNGNGQLKQDSDVSKFGAKRVRRKEDCYTAATRLAAELKAWCGTYGYDYDLDFDQLVEEARKRIEALCMGSIAQYNWLQDFSNRWDREVDYKD